MARLLTFLMILAMVFGQGSAMANAVCRHQNLREHVLARQSHDASVAAVSQREDAAADAASKKGSRTGDTSSQWPAQLLPPAMETARAPRAERTRLRPARHAPLPSAVIRPLLEPPSA
jgi:hypothetical protein